MDAYDTETERVEKWRKGAAAAAAADEIRPPLGPSEKHNAAIVAAARKLRTREVTSRYKSPLTPMRLSSNTTTTTTTTTPVPKRAQSAERRQSTTPPSSPSRPSTPVSDSPFRSFGGRTIEGLWPSTRSLSVSFQVDAFSIPVIKRERPVSPVKRERPVTAVSSVQTLRNSANLAQRQNERAATPERKRTPLRGRANSDLSENSRPAENAHAKVFDQHRWPSRTGGKLFANSTRSVDLTDKGTKATSLPIQGRGVSLTRRTVVSDSRRFHKSVTAQLDPDGSRRFDCETGSTHSADDAPSRISGVAKFISLSPRYGEPIPPEAIKPIPLETIKPIPHQTLKSFLFRKLCHQSIQKGKKGATQIEEVHQLRLLHNRYLQWRFVNARADVALSIQEMTSENILYNVWSTTSELRDSVTMKQINLQQMKQEMKLNSILKEQDNAAQNNLGHMNYLENWASAEREHSSSLAGAIQALEASTVRLPVTIGARADVRTLKEAISSAVDIMQAMGSSICSLLPRVEETNHLVSQLACAAAQERAMLDECGVLLASTAALQVTAEFYMNPLTITGVFT
ncbi:hypothetical protein ACLOJK_041786 [Asimina triloba]